MEGESQELQKLRERAAKQKEAEAKIKLVLQQLLDSQAQERLSNIKLSNPTMYEQVVSVLLSLYQGGQLKGKVTDEMLKSLLSRMLSQRKETAIKFMHK